QNPSLHRLAMWLAADALNRQVTGIALCYRCHVADLTPSARAYRHADGVAVILPQRAASHSGVPCAASMKFMAGLQCAESLFLRRSFPALGLQSLPASAGRLPLAPSAIPPCAHGGRR